MRSLGKAILAGALALFIAPAALAQDAAPGPRPAGLPKGPVPYTQIAPKPKPKPAAATASTAPKPTAATASTVAPALPRLANGARLAPGEALNPAELEAFLDGWIADAMAREHVPGVSVSVVQNGQVILKKGYGFADLASRKRVDPDRTLFRLGSVSKTFT